jgi:HK97 family phage portal protein
MWPFSRTKASATAQAIITTPGQARWTPRDYARLADESYVRNNVAYRAVRLRAQSLARVKWEAWRGRGERATMLTEHPILNLLARPNPYQSGDEWMIARASYRDLSGNSFDERVRLGRSVRELYTLRPDRMKIVEAARGGVQGYVYEVNGRRVQWEVDPVTGESDILHCKNFHPLNDWYGLSPVEAAAYAIDLHNDNMAAAQAQQQNGARPSGALVIDNDALLTEQQFADLKASVEEQYSGVRNSGKPLVLRGMQWQAMGLSPRDMEALEARSAAARDVAATFGVPSLLLGLPGDNTYANQAEARLAFWEDTMLPLAQQTAEELTNWLAPYFGDVTLRASIDDIPAIAEKRKVMWDMADKATDLTINERRELKGFPPLPGGDVLLVSANQITLANVLEPDNDRTEDLPPEDAARLAFGDDEADEADG